MKNENTAEQFQIKWKMKIQRNNSK